MNRHSDSSGRNKDVDRNQKGRQRSSEKFIHGRRDFEFRCQYHSFAGYKHVVLLGRVLALRSKFKR